VAGVFVGSGLWWLLLSGGAALFRSRFDARAMRILNRASGALILSLGVYAMWTTVRA